MIELPLATQMLPNQIPLTSENVSSTVGSVLPLGVNWGIKVGSFLLSFFLVVALVRYIFFRNNQ